MADDKMSACRVSAVPLETAGIQDDAWVELESDCGLIYYWNRKSLESVQMLPKGVEAMWAVRKAADGRACFWQKSRSDETAAKPVWALPPFLSALAGQSWAGKPQPQGTLTAQCAPASSIMLTAFVERLTPGAFVVPAVEAEFVGEAVLLQSSYVSELAAEEPASLVRGMQISSAAPVEAETPAVHVSAPIAQDSVTPPATLPEPKAHLAQASPSVSMANATSIVDAVPVVQGETAQVRVGVPMSPNMSMQAAGLITENTPTEAATHPTCAAPVLSTDMAEKPPPLEVVKSHYDKQEVETANEPVLRTTERELTASYPPVDVAQLSARIAEATSDSMQLREEMSRLKAELAELAAAGSSSERSAEPVLANAPAFAPEPVSADRLIMTLGKTSAGVSASFSQSSMVQCDGAAAAELISQGPCTRFESKVCSSTSGNVCSYSSELACNVKKPRSREGSNTQPPQVAPSNMGARCETNESSAKKQIPHWQIWLRAKQQEATQIWLNSEQEKADESKGSKLSHESQGCTSSRSSGLATGDAAQAVDTLQPMDSVRCKSSPRLPSSKPRRARVQSPGQKKEKKKVIKTASKKRTKPAVALGPASAEAARAAAYHAQMAHYQFTAHAHHQQQCQAAAAAHAHYQASVAFQYQLATQMPSLAPPASAHSEYCVGSGSTGPSDSQNSISSKRSRLPARRQPTSSTSLGSNRVNIPQRLISGKRSRSPARLQPKASPSRSLSRRPEKKKPARSISSKRSASPARWRPEASPSRSLSRNASSPGGSRLAPNVASCTARMSPSRSPSSTRKQGSPPDKLSNSEQPAASSISKSDRGRRRSHSSRPCSVSVSSRCSGRTRSKTMFPAKDVGSRSRLPSPARSRHACSRSAVRHTELPSNSLRRSPTKMPSSSQVFLADASLLTEKNASHTPTCSGSKAGSQDPAVLAGNIFAKAVGGLAPKVARLRKRSSWGGA